MTARRSRRDYRPGARRARTVVGALLVALVVVGAAVFGAGCGINTGPTQELAVDEPLGWAAVTDVEVTMGAGKLTVSPGATGLVSGLIRYNVESWKPTVARSDSRLTIKQGGSEGPVGPRERHRQRVAAATGQRAHAAQGLRRGLRGLLRPERSGAAGADHQGRGRQGAGLFNSPNPGQMERLQYETGASTVTLTRSGQRQLQDHGLQRRSRVVHAGLLGAAAHRRHRARQGRRGDRAHSRPCADRRPGDRRRRSDRRLGGGLMDRQRQDLQHAGRWQEISRPRR